MYTYEYPRPAVSVDVVVMDSSQGTLRLLLIERLKDPFAGRWALPGGFLEMDETLETAARRELLEETELEISELLQLGAYSAVNRDPRGRVISVAFLAIVTEAREVKAGDDARSAQWHFIDQLPPLAFDHDQIVEQALNRYRESRLLLSTPGAMAYHDPESEQ